ncbi:MAG: glycoside hydrolase family 88 protein [Bacteroidota bacterium]|jgi:unsaturated chondroitin disaccharide hydrolase
MNYLFTAALLFLTITSNAQKSRKEINELINRTIPLAISQFSRLDKATPITKMPRSYDPKENKLTTSDIKWWCSGFFPGSLWYLYELSNSELIKTIAEKRTKTLEPLKYFTDNHDVGFMVFCPFGNAYRITGDSAYRNIINTAAKSLSTRYKPSIKSIQSWESNSKLACPVIIDNMMNLELLYWSSKNGGESTFSEIANNHAITTLKNHFRSDNSSYHVVDYDLNTGNILKKITWQGAHDTSAWSRGQSWGLYGYTMMYRFTKNDIYLSQAKKIANFLVNHPNLPSDKIPLWDFNVINNKNTLRDASAGAIMASALLELATYVNKKDKKIYIQAAETIILSLGSTIYLSKEGQNDGFLLKHSVGSIPNNSEVDVSLTYADYYFLESLQRYKKWYL